MVVLLAVFVPCSPTTGTGSPLHQHHHGHRAVPDCGNSPPFSFFATAWDATCEGTTNAVHLNGSNWCASPVLLPLLSPL